MDFRILGPFEVDDDGRSVQLGGARQRALLAILLLHRGEVVSSDRLIESLYDGEPPATAGKSLQAHVSRLRRALEPADRLHTRAGGYVLEVAADEVDAGRFVRLLGEGRTALAAGQAHRAADSLGAALALWRGSPLADFAYQGFAQDEIARLEQLRLECLEERFEAELALGREAAAVAELEQLLAENPLRERLRGQLMLALYRCGRQADALASYQEGRRALVEELGIEPGRPLQELERAILNQEPRLDPLSRPVAATVVEEAAGLVGGTFVGRERELALLEEALADARAGRGRLVLLSGEAGIGKSRLADELANRARALRMTVLWGAAWEAGGAPAYWPWVQALRVYVRETEPAALREQLGVGASEVAQILPELRELFPDLPESRISDSEDARFRLYDATASFLRRAAEGTPLLVVLDDVHAADQSSLQLLEFVAASLAGAKAIVLASYRDPELEPGDPIARALADVSRRASTRIVLTGLDRSEVGSYIAQGWDFRPSPRVVDTIAAETEGNPLFVGEIVRLLAVEANHEAPTDTDWRPTIPETVKEVIGRRLSRLSTECRELLSLASVAGREFPLDVVGRLSGSGPLEVLSRLEEAVPARVVADVAGAPGRMRFTHALIRDTLYDALPHARRLELHRRTAEALEEVRGPDNPDSLSELAHHYFQALPAVDADTAVAYARRAADQAKAVLAHGEAARVYRNALRALALRSVPDPDLERALLLELGEALSRSGDTPSAKDVFLQAANLARQSKNTADLSRAALGYCGVVAWTRPAGDRLVVALLEEALEAVGDTDSALQARLLGRLAGALRDERDERRRIEVGEQAVALARRLGDPATLAYGLSGLAAAQHGHDDHGRRLEVTRELREVASESGNKQGLCEALTAENLIHAERNDFEALRANVRLYADLANDLRQPSQSWLARAFEAMLALHEGRFQDAERLARQAFEIGERAQAIESNSAYAVQLYLLRREQGLAGEAKEPLQRSAADNPARPFFRCALATLAVDAGNLAEARRLFEELAVNSFEVVPPDNERFLAAAFLTEACSALGDTTRAATLYEQHAHLAEWGASNTPEGSAGAMARTLGVLAAMLGRPEEAIAHHRRAIEIDTATGGVPWVAYAQAELAAILAERGERDEAAGLRAAASATADELGMLRLRARLDGVALGSGL
jgi:DNA-binding SARP family transcriptional activator